jgi:DNA mismatch endonuclease (patch repair protein)
MSGNKAKDTQPELLVRQALCRYGLRGYRLHPKQVPGKPDICYISRKIAIFVNGCYWHRCPYCKYSLPKHNRSFWKQKFLNNIKRDTQKAGQLRKESWKVIVLWECQIKGPKSEKTMLRTKKIIETRLK